MKYIPILLFCFFTSCWKCTDKKVKKLSFSDEFKSYTDMFVPNNWWVYKSTDGTKTDSIYISNWRDSVYNDRTNLCKDVPIITFNLHSDFLIDSSIKYSIIAKYYSRDEVFNIISTIGNPKGFIIDNVIITQDRLISYNRNNVVAEGLFFLGNNNNTIVLGKDIGILFYTSGSDTFFLDKYFVR